MIGSVIRILAAFAAAFFTGKAVSRLKLPSILGWLIAGMVLGPHGVNLLDNALLNSGPYTAMTHIFECAVGLMIGTELVWKRIRKSGKSIIITTLTQSLGTFIVVSAVFGVVFRLCGISLYLAFIFGSIALATAPAPALSIVKEFKTSGPVTSTLIPMAALDDMVGVVVFFTTISVVSGTISGQGIPAYLIPVVMVFPLAIGAVTGLPAGLLLKKHRPLRSTLLILIAMILLTTALGAICNTYIMPRPVLNFMLMGMSFQPYSPTWCPRTGCLKSCMNSVPSWAYPSSLSSWDWARPGLPSDYGRRSVHCRVHCRPCLWKILRGLVRGQHHRFPKNRKELSGSDTPSPLRCLPCIHRHLRLRPVRCSA